MGTHLLAWFTKDHIWLVIGFIGNGLFASRFIVQWITSEREGRSVIPVAFWYFSIGGGIITLAYATYIQSWPYMCAQGVGLIPYFRNLWLITRERNALKEAAERAA